MAEATHGVTDSMVSMVRMWDYGEWGVKLVKKFLMFKFIVHPQGNFVVFPCAWPLVKNANVVVSKSPSHPCPCSSVMWGITTVTGLSSVVI